VWISDGAIAPQLTATNGPAARRGAPCAWTARCYVDEAANTANPQRWSGPTRNWQPLRIIHMNPNAQATLNGSINSAVRNR